MYLRLMGSAAGGGFPQWNCACRICSLARSDGARTLHRSQSSLAISATGRNWYLVNCSPDLRAQIESTSVLRPGPGLRDTPIKGVLLTDAELDHTAGLLSLREGPTLDVFATSTVVGTLSGSFPVKRILSSYSYIRWVEVEPGEEFTIDDYMLSVQVVSTGAKRPRYAGAETFGSGWVVGYLFKDRKRGSVVFYAPAIEYWNPELEAMMDQADCVLVDGTFWTEDEMIASGVGQLSARLMGHLPLAGTAGSALRLKALSSKRKILVHINDTNPILDSESEEAKTLAAMNIEVGTDGMELEL